MFEDLKNMCARVSSLDDNKIIEDILSDSTLQEQIVALNQNQMLSGLGADGNSLPRYENDPFFKTQKAAKAYENWKSKISPNPEKDPGVMDFYITGQFHSTLKVVPAQKSFRISTDSEIADDIEDKTNDEALGLNDESLNVIIPDINDRMINRLEKAIGI